MLRLLSHSHLDNSHQKVLGVHHLHQIYRHRMKLLLIGSLGFITNRFIRRRIFFHFSETFFIFGDFVQIIPLVCFYKLMRHCDFFSYILNQLKFFLLLSKFQKSVYFLFRPMDFSLFLIRLEFEETLYFTVSYYQSIDIVKIVFIIHLRVYGKSVSGEYNCRIHWFLINSFDSLIGTNIH